SMTNTASILPTLIIGQHSRPFTSFACTFPVNHFSNPPLNPLSFDEILNILHIICLFYIILSILIHILSLKQLRNEVEKLGRDEHNHAEGKNRLAQAPRNQLTEGKDVEFSEEFADSEDKEAQIRIRAADKRMKRI